MVPQDVPKLRPQASASAPGKVILFGEHAVVYGKPAIAAAVSDLRVHVDVVVRDDAKLSIRLHDLDLDNPFDTSFELMTETLLQVFMDYNALTSQGGDLSNLRQPSTEFVSRLLELVKAHSHQKQKAYAALLFLSGSILSSHLLDRGLNISVRSASLPIGSGLGSSAAFSVASSAALLALVLEQNQNLSSAHVAGLHGQIPPESILDSINQWAFAAETIIHGNPSGLDNTVSCKGGAIQFSKAAGGVFKSVENFPRMRILLTNTTVPRDTKTLVGGVKNLLGRLPRSTEAVLDAIGVITEEFMEILKEGGNHAENYGIVGRQMEMNHSLLNALGVGHPQLDLVCAETYKRGMYSKLTGAGGGGCAVTLLSLSGEEEATPESRIIEVVDRLESHGFDTYQTDLGGAGVLWHNHLLVTKEQETKEL